MVVGHPLTPHTTSSLRGPRPVPLPPQSLPPTPPPAPTTSTFPLPSRSRSARHCGWSFQATRSLSLSRLHWAVEVKTWRDPARSLKVAATSFPVFSFLLHYHNYHHHRHKSWAFSTNIVCFFLLSFSLNPPPSLPAPPPQRFLPLSLFLSPLFSRLYGASRMGSLV